MESIKQALIQRDGISPEEAEKLITSAKADLDKRIEDPSTYGAPYNVCEDWFDLDADYLTELL